MVHLCIVFSEFETYPREERHGPEACTRSVETPGIRFASVVALLLFEASFSFAASSPLKPDVKATCRRAQPLTPRDTSAYQSCMNDELAAQKGLAEKRSPFKPGAQSTCVQETQRRLLVD
jgi:hypothetical protein